MRALGDKLIVARPIDGAPVVLSPIAAVVWRDLDSWTTTAGIDRRLARAFPEVASELRHEARVDVLTTLTDDGLLEQR